MSFTPQQLMIVSAAREIAEQLVVNETTIKSHINHLFAKTGVRDRAQAVTYAYQHGLT